MMESGVTTCSTEEASKNGPTTASTKAIMTKVANTGSEHTGGVMAVFTQVNGAKIK